MVYLNVSNNKAKGIIMDMYGQGTCSKASEVRSLIISEGPSGCWLLALMASLNFHHNSIQRDTVRFLEFQGLNQGLA